MSDTLGPYELGAFIAKGGMGEVYEATHRATKTRAAIKLVAEHVRWSQKIRDEFLREVQASASLEHPCIISVFDYGEVTPAEAAASDVLYAGTPWFAMEYATLGSLATSRAAPQWRVARRVLSDILDALAHAHARGLTHRDLKPANVLVTERGNEVSIVLADFGIAHVEHPDGPPLQTADILAPSAGTPSYMSPEQIHSDWRQLGPWTDLYALGCVGWEMVTGSPPFVGSSALDVMIKHVSDELPPFEPRYPVPPGLEAWFRRLTAKAPKGRFRRAADAAWALLQLDDPGIDTSASVSADGSFGARLLASAASDVTLGAVDGATEQIQSDKLRTVRRADAGRGARLRVEHPPPPPDWRENRSYHPQRPGLGLFGIRNIPLVDRNDERDVIWQTILESIQEHGVRAVILRGEPGRGKSTLLQWAANRTHELGTATTFRAGHGEFAGLHDGLPKMLSRHLGCSGLARPEAFRHIRDRLSGFVNEHLVDDLAAGLTQIVRPAKPGEVDDVPAVQFGSPRERYGVVERLLRATAAVRPVVITLDDAQWGADALAFVDHALGQPPNRSFPLTFVIAINSDGLNTRPLESERLRAIAARREVRELPIGRLPPSAHMQLVDELLGLDPELAAELVDASGGDPIFSTSVIADWVQRGALTTSANGYRFPAGVDFELPTTAEEVCEARFDRVCAQFALPARCRHMLQIAAALGDQVDVGEWNAVCNLRGLRPPHRLIQALVDAGLVTQTESSFEFPHRAMVGALRQAARREARWHAIHSDCARVVDQAAGDGSSAHERRSEHLLRAREVERALEALAEAVRYRVASSAYREAIHLSDAFLQHRRELGAHPPDDMFIRVIAARADAHRFIGQTDQGHELATELLDLARERDAPLAQAEGLRVLAGLQQRLGHDEVGIDTYSRAEAVFRKLHDVRGQARCAHGRGWLNLNLGRFAEGMQDFQRGASLSQSDESTLEQAWSLQGFAESALYLGFVDQARPSAEQSLERFRASGSRSGQGMALATIGNVCRAERNFDEARSYYRAAINHLTSFDSPLAAFPMLHSIWLELREGDLASLTASIQLVQPDVRTRMPAGFRIAYGLAQLYALAMSGGNVSNYLNEFARIVTDDGHGAHPMVPAVLADVKRLLKDSQATTVARIETLLAPILDRMGDR